MEWNIFARELRDILENHGATLNKLIDRAGIHPQKVARLQRSLQEPKFNMLSPAELERVYQAFSFTPEEQLRLRAAILATAVEEMLMNRINSDDALDAANQILPIIYRMLKVRVGRATTFDQIKAGVMVFQPQETIFEEALDLIDRAIIALHLSDQSATPLDRVAYARQACTIFEAAMAKMDLLSETVQENEIWKIWRQEAKNGLLAAQELLTKGK